MTQLFQRLARKGLPTGRVALCAAVSGALLSVLATPLSQRSDVVARPDAKQCLIQPARTVRVGSPVPGLLDAVPVGRGDLVEKGDTVGKLRDDVQEASVELYELRADDTAAIAQNRAQLDLARKQLDRAERLYERDVMAAQKVDQRRAQARVERQDLRQSRVRREEARLQLDRARERLEQRQIASPIAGVVTKRQLTGGEFVHQETHILEIAKLNPLHVEVFLPVSAYGRVQEGMQAEVWADHARRGEARTATVTVVDRVLDPASGTFGVRLRLPNPDYQLPAGVRCSIDFDGNVTRASGGGSAAGGDLRSIDLTPN